MTTSVQSLKKAFLFLLYSSVALGIALTSFFFQVVHAAPPGLAGGGVVSPAFGTYADTIQVDVPKYYGITPQLRLVYASSGGSGYAGVGWSLSGQSVIERATVDRGAPRYNSSDNFFLDGEKLLTNTSFGGTHVTQHLNYMKIQQDTANNRWYVWKKDGTKSTYSAVFTNGLGTYRWAVTSVQDTNGHVVNYNYWTDIANGNVQGAYLDTITYNGYSVKFWREPRPDPITWASGALICFTNYRLKTIEIKVGSSENGVYKLSYSNSGNSGRSLLDSVKKYGTDVVLDGTGTITSGTSLPAEAMTYNLPGGSGYPTQTSNNVTGGWNTANKIFYADVNGDGKQDQVTIWNNSGSAYAQVRLSDGTSYNNCSFNQSIGYLNGNSGWAQYNEYYLMDVNGDGRADLVLLWNNNGTATAQVSLSDGNGFPHKDFNTPIGGWDDAHNLFRDNFGDVNGDGKTDLIRVWKNGNNISAQVNLWSDSTGWANWTNTVVGGWNDVNVFMFGDVNGDGKADMVLLWPNNNWVNAQVNSSDGSNFNNFDSNLTLPGGGGWNTGTKNYLMDANGDGKADLVRIWNNGGNSCVTIYASYGYQYPWTITNRNVGGWDSRWRDYFADINGDGLPDFVRIWTPDGSNANAQINLNRQADFPTQDWNATIGGWNTNYVDNLADVDGDGKADLIVDHSPGNGSQYTQINLAATSGGTTPADLLIARTNGMGATTSISYSPATVWPSQYLPRGGASPTVSQIVIDDGRGVSGKTTYSYADMKISTAPRANLGFGYQKAIFNDQGSYTEIYNRQTLQSLGQATDIYTKSSAGAIFSRESFVYTEGGDGAATPYTTAVTQTSEYDYDLTSGYRKTQTDVQYDSYLNLIQVTNQGDTGVTGDETLKVTNFSYNTSSYIVSKASSEQVYSGTTVNANNKLQDTQYFYDGASSSATAPVKGNVTRVDMWNDQTGQFISGTSTFDSYGNVVTTTDANGNLRTTTFDTTYHQFPVQETNALNQSTTMTWDYVKNVVLSTTNPNGITTTSTYDIFSRKLTTTDALGNVATVQYLNIGDPNNQRTRNTTPDGSSDGLWTDTYMDGLGRTYKVVKEGPSPGVTYIQETKFSDAGKNPSQGSAWYQSGSTPVWESYLYDGIGRLVKTTHADGSFSTTSYNMDASSKPYVTVTDELGHITSTWSDTHGKPIHMQEMKNASLYDTYNTYDLKGNLVQVKDTYNHISSYVYDSLGREISSNDMDLGSATYTYDDRGLLLTRTDAEGQTTSYTYDVLGRPTTNTIPAPTNFAANSGAESGSSTPDSWGSTLANGATATFAWDTTAKRTGGKSLSIANPSNWAEWYNSGSVSYNSSRTYTAKAWVKTSNLSTNSASVKLEFFSSSWTWLGQTQSTGIGGTKDWQQIAATATPGSAPAGTAYVKMALIVSSAASGTAWYDDASLSDGTGTATSTYYYDEAGHGWSVGKLTRMVYPAGSQSMMYDSLGRITSLSMTIGSITKTLSKTYDSENRVATMTYPDGEVVTNGYGLDGRLNSVSGYVSSMSYGPNGNLTQIVYTNGTSTNYTYDPNRLWLNTANVTSGGTTLYTASYSYNALQQVTSMTQGTPAGLTSSYSYDDLNRLTGVTGNQNQSFQYDAIGNMTYNSQVGNYIYSDAAHPHAVTAAGSATYTYDADGNMTSGNGRILTWDSQNRLTAVTQAAGATTYTYGEGEQRLSKTNGPNTTLYFGNLLDIVNGSPIQYYYADQILVAKKDAAGTKSWYHSDRLGSVRLMTNSSGAEVKDYDYRPFGDVLTTTGTIANERGFTGQVLDTEDGLMYYKARYYDAQLGRFLSADSASADSPQDLNKYSYCMNNPVNSTDPTGHKWVEVKTKTTVDTLVPVHEVINTVLSWVITYPTFRWVGDVVEIGGWTFWNPVAHFVEEDKHVTISQIVQKVVDTIVHVAKDVWTSTWQWIDDFERDPVGTTQKTVQGFVQGLVKSTKQIINDFKPVVQYICDHPAQVLTIALTVVCIVAIPFTCGTSGLFASMLMSAEMSFAATTIIERLTNPEDPWEKTLEDSTVQAIFGFFTAGIGAYVQDGIGAFATAAGIGPKVTFAMKYTGNMLVNFAGDMANNMVLSGKSPQDALTASGKNAVGGSMLTAWGTAVDANHNSGWKLIIGTLGIAWSQKNRVGITLFGF